MTIDTTTLAGQILKALDTGSQLPDVMEKVLDEARNSQNAKMYVQQVLDQVKVYPGEAYDDDRQQAIGLLQQMMEYED